MAQLMFKKGRTLEARDGHAAYRIEKHLGSGGFGQTYKAEQLTVTGRRRPRGKGVVCLKVTTDPKAWHGEAYFGLLTRGLPHVVQHIDSFPYRTHAGMRYVLIMELMPGMTVQDWLEGAPVPWTAGQVINALRPLASAVGALHASGAMHRDIKPANVFICNRKNLCLCDFGIARHGMNGRGPRADYLTPAFVATSLLHNRQEWLPSDDVFQLGLLGLSLLLGELIVEKDCDWRRLRHRVMHDGLRQVLKRATGARADRYISAGDFHRDLAAISPTRVHHVKIRSRG